MIGIMKKILWGFVPLFCMLAVLTACSDDDDNTDSTKIAGTFAGGTLGLHEGGSSMAVANKSVEVSSTSDGKATFILNNVVPDAESVQIEATLTSSSSNVTFSGSTVVNDCTVGITGTYASNYLDVDVSRSFNGSQVGTWKMTFDNSTGTNIADMYLNIVTGNAVVDALIPQVKTIIGGFVGSKITAMTMNLKDDGTVGIQWTTADGKTTSVPDELQLQYCFRDANVFLTFDKNLTDVAKLLLTSQLAAYNLTVDQITTMLTNAGGDLGGYFGIPMSIKIETSTSQVAFYMSKSLVVPLLTVLQPLISKSIPSTYATMMTTLMSLLPSSKTVDLGASFTKG
jgi:hypothetical protein